MDAVVNSFFSLASKALLLKGIILSSWYQGRVDNDIGCNRLRFTRVQLGQLNNIPVGYMVVSQDSNAFTEVVGYFDIFDDSIDIVGSAFDILKWALEY